MYGVWVCECVWVKTYKHKCLHASHNRMQPFVQHQRFFGIFSVHMNVQYCCGRNNNHVRYLFSLPHPPFLPQALPLHHTSPLHLPTGLPCLSSPWFKAIPDFHRLSSISSYLMSAVQYPMYWHKISTQSKEEESIAVCAYQFNHILENLFLSISTPKTNIMKIFDDELLFQSFGKSLSIWYTWTQDHVHTSICGHTVDKISVYVYWHDSHVSDKGYMIVPMDRVRG